MVVIINVLRAKIAGAFAFVVGYLQGRWAVKLLR